MLELWEEGSSQKDCTAPKKSCNVNQEKNPSVNDTVDDLHDALILSLVSPESWVIDSGASFHACPNKSIFNNIIEGDLGKVYPGDDKVCNISDKGDVDIGLPNGSIWNLTDKRYVPCLKINLISVSQHARSGFVAALNGDSWKVTKGAMIVARGNMKGTQYLINKVSDSIVVAKTDVDVELWHKRLRHMSEKGITTPYHAYGSAQKPLL